MISEYEIFHSDINVINRLLLEWYISESKLLDLLNPSVRFNEQLRRIDCKTIFTKDNIEHFHTLFQDSASSQSSVRWIETVFYIKMMIQKSTEQTLKDRFISNFEGLSKVFDSVVTDVEIKEIIDSGWDWIWLIPILQRATRDEVLKNPHI